jgi:hypothetical protein
MASSGGSETSALLWLNLVQVLALPFVVVPLSQLSFYASRRNRQMKWVLASLLVVQLAILIWTLGLIWGLCSSMIARLLVVGFTIVYAVLLCSLAKAAHANLSLRDMLKTSNFSNLATSLLDEDAPLSTQPDDGTESTKICEDTAADSTFARDRGSGLRVFDYALALFAAISGILFGYDLGVISGALLPISQDFSLSTFDQELMVSTLLLGALLGSPLGGATSDSIGRRPAILVSSALYCQGTLMEAFAPTFNLLLLGRIMVGVGVGMGSMTTPLYVSELARPSMRGRLVAVNELATAFGVLTAFVAGLGLQDTLNGWRWMLGLAGAPAVLQFACCAIFPESPKYICSRIGLLHEVRGRAPDARTLFSRYQLYFFLMCVYVFCLIAGRGCVDRLSSAPILAIICPTSIQA